MRLTSIQFLQLACRWAYDHHTLSIDDDEFLPQIKKQGVSDNDIDRLKKELEGQGVITNYYSLDRLRDFALSKSVFRRYLRQVLPAATLAKARSLHEDWKHSPHGPFDASVFVEHLGVSEAEASYTLRLFSERDLCTAS